MSDDHKAEHSRPEGPDGRDPVDGAMPGEGSARQARPGAPGGPGASPESTPGQAGREHPHHPFDGEVDVPVDGDTGMSEQLDPGYQEFADALRLAFKLLKLVMAAVLVLFVLGGIYKVEQNEQAILLRFGRVQGAGASLIKQPGLHWAFPSPIDEVIRIPGATTVRRLDIEDFWYYQSKEEKLGLKKSRATGPLQFVRDGYSLTASTSVATVSLSDGSDRPSETGVGGAGRETRGMGPGADAQGAADRGDRLEAMTGDAAVITDYNIMHSQWRLFYRITDPITFVREVWDGTEIGWRKVEHLLRCALADAVITTSANRDIALIWDRPERIRFKEDVHRRMIERLAELDIGIELTEKTAVVLEDVVAPRQVKTAFDRAARANIEAEKLRTQARAEADKMIGKARSDAEVILAEARAYRERLVEIAKADESYFREVLEKVDQAVEQRYPGEGPEVAQQRRAARDKLMRETVDELYQEMLREVIASADEIMVAPTADDTENEWRVYLSRDARISKQKNAGDDQPGTR